MNILKSSDLNSTTLRKIEIFHGKDYFYGFLYVCVEFHGNFLIKCSTF